MRRARRQSSGERLVCRARSASFAAHAFHDGWRYRL